MNTHNVVGWIVGIGVFLFAMILVPEAVCSDGWASPSIGRQGACSHHGGVSGASGFMMTVTFWASVLIGGYIADKLNPDAEDRPKSDFRPRRLPPQKRWYTDKNGRRRSYWK